MRSFSRTFLISLAACISVSAGTLQIIGTGTGVNSSVGPANNQHAGDELVDSQTYSFSANTASLANSFEARAGFGDLGVSFKLMVGCGAICGTNLGRIVASTYSFDNLAITGLTSGVLALDVLVEGTAIGAISSLSNNTSGAISYWIGQSNNSPSAIPSFTLTYTGPEARETNNYNSDIETSYLYDSVNDIYHFSFAGTAMIPFQQGRLNLGQQLHGVGSCFEGTPRSCQLTFDAFHSAKVGGAVVYDSFGNLVQGATITSDSGFDYTRPLASSVPEPATVGMTALGLLALAIFKSRRHAAGIR